MGVGTKLKKAGKKVGDAIHDATHAHKAPKMNREARSMSETAIKEVETKYNEVEAAAIDLANLENKVKASFSEFQDLVEKIHNRPDIKSEIDKISVPGANFSKVHSSYIDMAKCTIAGVVLFASTPISIPLVLITGALTYRKAERNLEKAKETVEEAKKAICKYNSMIISINKMIKCIQKVYTQYLKSYGKLEFIVEDNEKIDYQQYTDKEKAVLNNTVKLVQILVTLFKATIKEQQLEDANINNDENIDAVELELSEEKINEVVENMENELDNMGA